LLTGVILGPMLLGFIRPNDSLDFLASLGVILMMFIMGLSIDIESVMKTNAKSASAITLIGAALVISFSVILILIIGTLIGQNIYFSLLQGFFVGVTLTSTSTVIGFRYLTDIGDRFSSVFKTLIAVEITDGIFSIMALAVLLSIISLFAKATSGGTLVDPNTFLPEVGWSTFKLFLLMLGFIIFVIKFGGVVTDWLLGISHKSGGEQSIITLSLIVLFAIATLSDWLQLTYVIGAFLAGAILAGSQFSSTVIEPKIKAIGYGLFIPIFFAYTGIQMNFGALLQGPSLHLFMLSMPLYLILFLGLLVTVMGGKYIGAIAGCAVAGGYKSRDANRIGFSLMCVGEDTLVLGGIGATMVFTKGGPFIISPELFSVLGLLIIVSSILAPIFIKTSFEEKSYTPPMAPRTKTNLSGKPKGKIKSL
jgi:Kef-type K+ transport system membrane component KefB